MSTIPTQVQEDQTDRVVPSVTPPPRSRRLGRRSILVGGLLVVAAGGGVVTTNAVRSKNSSGSGPAISNGQTATTTVQKTKLVSQTRVNGTLGYAGSYEVVNRANGTLTKLPAVGDVVKHGAVLYEVDGKSVVLLHGSIPVYRALSRTLKGADVQQLNAELVALGYGKLDPNSDTFSLATQNAVKKLQKQVGLKQTGSLELDQAVFLVPEEIRITKLNASHGGPASPGAIMETSSLERLVVVALEASRAGMVKAGDQVTVTLPDLKSTPGIVTSIDTVAKKPESGSPTVDVYIKLTNPSDAGPLDQAPVQVSIVSTSVDDALAVPVNALLALAGGGFAIEVIETNNIHKLYQVQLGLFDDSAGMVQITGAGVAAGQTIVVPTA